MKKCLALFALVLFGAVGAQAPAAAPRPKLILALVVDQMRYDYLVRFRSDFNSGLERLLTRGAVFTNAHYEHMPTVTAIGHSIVLSGAMPAASGIVGNEWYDRDTKTQVTSVSDPTVKTLGAPAREGASPRRLLVSTLGDEMKLADRGPVKAIGISVKDRSAILPLGRGADGAYWFDSTTGNFVSSTYYFHDLPDWVNGFNRARKIDRWAGKEWLPVTGGGPALRKMPTELGKTFNEAVLASGFGNELLEEFVEQAVEGEKLGQNGGTDILSVSFSSNDTLGHKVGPHDAAVRQITIGTDRVLGRLFDFLDKRIGMDNVVVVLTADHGVAPLPEEMNRRRLVGGRVPEGTVLNAIEEALTSRFGEGPWVVGKSGPAPYLDHKLIAAKNLDLDTVQMAAAAAVRRLPQIARVFMREDMRRGMAQGDQIGRRAQNGFFYQRASDLMIVPLPYFLFEKEGTSHGTPYNYDSHVPMILMGQGIKAGRYHHRVAVNDIAPTLATYLDVETPSGSSGRVLDEAFVNPGH